MKNRLSLYLLSSLFILPAAARCGEWQVNAGIMSRCEPRTANQHGYGNHGLYGSAPDGELNRHDLKTANWDGAPGFFVELEKKRFASGRRGFAAGAWGYGRAVSVDTEYNETQQNWHYYSATGGIRGGLYYGLGAGITVFSGLAGGAASVGGRRALVWDQEWGVKYGALQLSHITQRLEGGRKIDYRGAVSLGFRLGNASPQPSIRDFFYGFTARVTRHPQRKVKNIHQSGFSAGLYLAEIPAGRLFAELELTHAPVESLIRRPINSWTPHNYRTQDELFWGAYLGLTRETGFFIKKIVVSAGLEAYHEDDNLVNPDGETGWFLGSKAKLAAAVPLGGATDLSFGLVVGRDRFGFNRGVEIRILSGL